jgi:isopropylmalate/homocitrate/citramalate synthase
MTDFGDQPATHWVASRHNFDPAIAVAPRPVELHDLTLRDGEEAADLAYTTADKVKLAEALARLGIKRTEVFLTVPGWQEVVRAILARNLDLDLWVTWQPDRVQAALDLGARHVFVWYRIGNAFQHIVDGRERSDIFDEMLRSVRAAKDAGCVVNLFLPEATRADLGHITDAAKAAEREGATYVTVVDSQGVARPGAIAHLVRHLKAHTGLKVEVHCHNDFGLAVANVLAGYEAGADVLQVSLNGVGYRAGNAALEAVAMALEVLYDVRTGLRLDLLHDTCRMLEQLTGLANGYFKPIVGAGAFRYEQWGQAQRFTAAGERRYAFPFEPEIVGRVPELMIGKWSDKQAVIQKLAEYGLAASADAIETIQRRAQRFGAARGRPLRDDEFLAIAEALGATDT